MHGLSQLFLPVEKTGGAPYISSPVKLLLNAVMVVSRDIFDQASGRGPAWHMPYLSAAHDETYERLVSNKS